MELSSPRAGTGHPDTSGQPAPARPLPTALAATLVFAASGAVLVLETVSLRLVGPYLGITLQVTSAVIGLALAAIAYGAWAGGRLADRRDPRPLLGPALVLAGVATALTLPVVRYAGEMLRGEATSGILLLTAAAVFVPAALLSAIAPMVVKLQLGDLRQTGQVVGRLSSIGTLGGITATLVTGFVLVAALPTRVIMIGLAALLGIGGIALAGWLRVQDRTAAAGGDGPAAQAGGDRTGARPGTAGADPRPGGAGRAAGTGPTTRPGRGTAAGTALAVLALTGALGAAAAPDPCDVETAYHCATVEADPDRATGRILVLNSAWHSYIDLADPRHLEFAYTQWIGAVADLVAPSGQRLDALHLGGGGFTVPRYLAATRPGTASEVYEVDGGLVDLARRELDLRTGPELRVAVGDARVLIGNRPAGSTDLVVGDAFGHLVVPWHLATREMAGQVRRVLRPTGIYVQNVIDYPPLRFVRAQVATVAAEFPHVALVAPQAALDGRQGANFLIVASATPLPLAALRERLATDEEIATGERVPLIDAAELDQFVGGARVLTDEYAPVDQLLATG